MMRTDWVQTSSGRAVRPAAIRPEDICLADIAHALSMQCRWTGHCRVFYSVAEHSCEVSRLLVRSGHSEDALWGLMHDATEAYLVDLAAPIKHTPQFQGFRDVEKEIMAAVCSKFGLRHAEPPPVKWADRRLLATEAHQLMAPLHSDWQDLVDPVAGLKLACLDWREARTAFLERFHDLTGGEWLGRELD